MAIFTGYGHVVVLVGYDDTHYYVHDPAGRWSQIYGFGGYSGHNSTEGRFVRYSRSAVDHAIAPDGRVWDA